ncbi:MAG: protein kinase domain-containing protein [Anaerolineae bacterium]
MHCENCGFENAPSAIFCAQCGYELQAPEERVPSPPPPRPAQPLLSSDSGGTMQAGQYRVVRPLSRGGMGALYLAENTRAFDRLCVIKEMVPYYEDGEEAEARQRFEQEARTLAALKHPGIPDIYGYFTETGRHYIVMEYIEGPTLADLSPHRGMRSSERAAAADLALWAGIAICGVLEYLARAGSSPVVHADIKPDNIIVDSGNGRAVLVDFGTAQARTQRRSRGIGQEARGPIYGTAGYAAPEIYRGYATPASDVYALAASLYLALTGDDPAEHPFRFPLLGTLRAPLAATLRQCLEHDPRKRPSVELLRTRLQQYRAEAANSEATRARARVRLVWARARPSQRARRKTGGGLGRSCLGLLLLLLAILIALAIAATYLLGPESPLRDPTFAPWLRGRSSSCCPRPSSETISSLGGTGPVPMPMKQPGQRPCRLQAPVRVVLKKQNVRNDQYIMCSLYTSRA